MDRNVTADRVDRRRVWVGLALLMLVGADAAWGSEPDVVMYGAQPDFGAGYVATISGTCDELIIGSRPVPTCGDTLLNVDFANGRVAFVFAGHVEDTVALTILSGGNSSQSDAGTYELAIDRMTTAILGETGGRNSVVMPAEGTCSMRGDPTHEPARFECRVRSAGRETIARFRSDGSPSVPAPGTR